MGLSIAWRGHRPLAQISVAMLGCVPRTKPRHLIPSTSGFTYAHPEQNNQDVEQTPNGNRDQHVLILRRLIPAYSYTDKSPKMLTAASR
jgi:hypothetical protein